MKLAIVTYANGDVIRTCINGTEETIKNYFKVGRTFNIGIVVDNMQQVVSCKVEDCLSDNELSEIIDKNQLAYN